MKKILFLACLALGVSACEKDPDLSNLDGNMVVYTDYDNSTDFSAYTTYFLPDSILEAGAIRASYWKDENAQTLIKEVEANLNSRGYTRITDPEKKDEADFGVQLSYIAETTQVVTGGYWNGWWDTGFWGPWWGGGWYYPYPVTYSYDTNALVMEMVDLIRKQEGEGSTSQTIPVVWYANAQGFKYSSGKLNLQLMVSGIDQAFMQSAYITRNK